MSTQTTKLASKAAAAAEQPFADHFNVVAAKLPGTKIAAVRAWREAALQNFLKLGLPHRRVEDWKYTDLRVLMKELNPLNGYETASSSGLNLALALGEPLSNLNAHRAVFVNGVFDAALSDLDGVKGVSFKTMRSSLNDARDAKFDAAALPKGDVIANLASAFVTDGAHLEIAAGAKLDKPLHLIFIAAASNTPMLMAYKNVIHIGEGADVTLLETHVCESYAQTFTFNQVTLGTKAHCQHIRLTVGGAGTHLSSLNAELAADCHYAPAQVTLDGAVNRAQANIHYKGEESRCHYTGAMLVRELDHTDFTLMVDHAAERCESRELVKAVLDDKARGVFQGKVIVRRGAQKTDGKQMANALLLSDDAEFDSKPELEIYADDVVCGHGATAGQIDEDLLFYLRTRGISKAEARALLIVAFVGEALEQIEHEGVREAIQEEVEAWLSGA